MGVFHARGVMARPRGYAVIQFVQGLQWDSSRAVDGNLILSKTTVIVYSHNQSWLYGINLLGV